MQLDSATAAVLGENVWKTKDGRELKWSEMSVGHLRNCAVHLRTRSNDRTLEALRVTCGMQGEMAQDMAEAAFDMVSDEMVLAERCAALMNAYANWRDA